MAAMDSQETALKTLIGQRHLSYDSFCREWDRVAKEIDPELRGAYPARAQYYRWLRGQLANKRPYPDACRMLEAMFPNWTVEMLFSPYEVQASDKTHPPEMENEHDESDIEISDSVDRNHATEIIVPSSGVRLELPNFDQIELLRQAMNEILQGSASNATIDEWEQIVTRYARATRDRAAVVLLGDISQDLAELNQLMRKQRSATAMRRLTRVSAQMSGLMMLVFCLLDDRRSFRKWARTANLAGNESGDPATLSWVLAQESYGHYYSGDFSEAIDVSRHAVEVVSDPCAGSALASALEARACAVVGRNGEAKNALAQAENTLSRLDEEALIPSAFGYNEASFRFHEGNAYTHMRDVKSAMRAQDQALALCPPDNYADWTMTSLDRAQCIIYSGDISGGLQYATETITSLPPAQRRGIIPLRGQEIIQALPEAERRLSAVSNFRELLASCASDK